MTASILRAAIRIAAVRKMIFHCSKLSRPEEERGDGQVA
jgi:hypothetical protein